MSNPLAFLRDLLGLLTVVWLARATARTALPFFPYFDGIVKGILR